MPNANRVFGGSGLACPEWAHFEQSCSAPLPPFRPAACRCYLPCRAIGAFFTMTAPQRCARTARTVSAAGSIACREDLRGARIAPYTGCVTGSERSPHLLGLLLHHFHRLHRLHHLRPPHFHPRRPRRESQATSSRRRRRGRHRAPLHTHRHRCRPRPPRRRPRPLRRRPRPPRRRRCRRRRRRRQRRLLSRRRR